MPWAVLLWGTTEAEAAAFLRGRAFAAIAGPAHPRPFGEEPSGTAPIVFGTAPAPDPNGDS